jgi:hypothetical protein
MGGKIWTGDIRGTLAHILTATNGVLAIVIII